MHVPEVSLDKRYGGKRNHESRITLTAHQYALPSSDCGNGISDVVPHLSHERNPAHCTFRIARTRTTSVSNTIVEGGVPSESI